MPLLRPDPEARRLRPLPNRPLRRAAWIEWLQSNPIGVTVPQAHRARVALGFEDNRASTRQALRNLAAEGRIHYEQSDGVYQGLVRWTERLRR
jgi:hypothetical protein